MGPNVVSAQDLVRSNVSVEWGMLTAEQREQEAQIQRDELGGINFYAHRGPDLDRREAFADTVFQSIQTLEQKRSQFDAVRFMFERKPGQYGQIVRVKRFYGAKVLARAYGGYKRRSVIRSANYTVTTNPSSVVVEIPIEELKAGIITASDIAAIMQEAVQRYKANLAWTTWVDALPQGGDYCDTYTGDVVKAELDTILNEVADQTEPGAIVARRTLLTPILGFAGYDGSTGYPESVKDEIHRTGWIGRYSGVNLVAIKSWSEELYDNVAVIAATSIIVLPRDLSISRFVEVGGLQRSSRVEQDTNTMIFYIDLEDGAAVFMPQYARRLLKTS